MDTIDRTEELCREYLSKVKCCDECFIEFYCIENHLRSSRVPQGYCVENLKDYLRPKGKWDIVGNNTYDFEYDTIAYAPIYKCSACGGIYESYLRLDEPIMPEDASFPKYCPNCGADMRED